MKASEKTEKKDAVAGKTRVAIDLTALAYNFTGIERYAAEITKNLLDINESNPCGMNFILIFKDEVHPMFASYVDAGKAETYIIQSNKGKFCVLQFELLHALKEIRADKNLFMAFPAPLLFKSDNCISVVHDLTCWDCPETITRKNRIFWRTAIRKVVADGNTIITVSEFSKGRIVRHFKIDPARVLVAYCGVSEVFMGQDYSMAKRDEVRSRYSLPDDFILTVGTIEPRKNISLLIRAWAELFREGEISSDLVLTGRSGWMTENLLCDLSNDELEHVHATGFVDDQDLPVLYSMSSLFVFPSLYEGFGMPPVEAVNSGAAVLCSDIECLQEICKDAVEYFTSNDLQDLKRAIVQGSHKGGHLSYRFYDSAMRIRDLLIDSSC